jgi:sulfide:quinone oxidoreductase
MSKLGQSVPSRGRRAKITSFTPMPISRRDFIKLSAAGLVGAVVVKESYAYLSQSKARAKIVIVGGGAAGITIAAYLSKMLRQVDVTIIEPEAVHRYQPGFTLVAADLMTPQELERTTKSLIPAGVKWLQDSVLELNPDHNRLTTAHTGVVSYDFLVVVPGCHMDFHLVNGISRETLGEGNVHCIYDLPGAQRCRDAVKKIPSLQGGNLVFTDTYTKMKCGGAPKKIALLAESLLRGKNRRAGFEFAYFNNEKTLMKPKVYGDRLAAIYAEREIKTHYLHRLASVNTATHTAVFHRLPEPSSAPLPSGHALEKIEVKFDFLHFVPPMRAPDCVRDSALTTAEERPKGGWVTVDKHTLVHSRYKNIISLGDVAGTPASKTGAAIRMQAPVAAANLISLMEGKEPAIKYNGYSACPIITEHGKVLMCEFGYDEKLLPTIPFLDPAIERGMWWTLKVHGLMPMYYHGMLKARV